MKYDSAIQQAVDYDVPHYLPETPISKTEAKRVVARRFMQQQKILLAKREEFVAPDRLELLKSGYILVRQYAPSQFRALNWPGERVVAFSFGIGAEPQVKRINAREV
jgi:hypothetical protein